MSAPRIKRDPAVTMTGVHATQIYDIVDQLLARNGLADEAVVGLNPCPFCEKQNAVVEYENGFAHVRCRMCGARGCQKGSSEATAEAIAAWNRRAA